MKLAKYCLKRPLDLQHGVLKTRIPTVFMFEEQSWNLKMRCIPKVIVDVYLGGAK
jgi:hypothetical protein